MPDGTLRVVQLNAGTLLEPGWPERRVEIIAWLERLRPDVVCLEEIYEDPTTQNTAAWLVEQMPASGWHIYFGGAPFAPELWPDPGLLFGSAILSRRPIDASQHVLLPLAPGPPPEAVGVPWELVHVRTAGLDVFACHLAAAPRDGLHRQVQVRAIDERIRGVRGDLDGLPGIGRTRQAMPAILCGDFNAEPDSDEIRFLTSFTALDGSTAFYQDAWRVAGDGPGLTQDWRTNPIAAAMNIHRKRIDYVFVGDPFLRVGGAGRVLAAEVAFDEPLTGVLASDHAGLVVDVLWPGRPT